MSKRGKNIQKHTIPVKTKKSPDFPYIFLEYATYSVFVKTCIIFFHSMNRCFFDIPIVYGNGDFLRIRSAKIFKIYIVCNFFKLFLHPDFYLTHLVKIPQKLYL